MDILRNVLLILHFVGLAALFGVWFSQIKAIAAGQGKVLPGMMHGAWLMLASGLGLVLVQEFTGSPNHMKIGIKLLVLIAIVVLALINRKKETVASGVMWALGGLALLNVVIAVFM